MKMQLFLAFLEFLLLCFVCGQDCNGTYDVLPEVERRARNYKVAHNEPFVTDEKLDYKWYDVGNRNIPQNDTNLFEGVCGTYFPVWMKGTTPEVNDGIVTRIACMISIYDPCAVEKTIEVRNCSTRMIYKLRPTRRSSAYCFDTLPDVSVMEEAPDFTPSSAVVSNKLQFIFDSKGRKIPKLEFSCDFAESPSESLFYKVLWFVNEVYLISKGPVKYKEIASTALKEDDLTARHFKLDITIKCGIRASKSPAGFLGNMTASPGFWLGIKILTPNIRIKHGLTGVIQLQSSVAFGCGDVSNVNDPSCILRIEMHDNIDSYNCTGTRLGSDKCWVGIRGSSYTETENNTLYKDIVNMTISTKDDNDFNIDLSVFVLALTTEKGTSANRIMDDNYLGDVRVQIEAESAWVRKNCYSRLDPHMLTFDQRNYENQNSPGEFILYRHKTYSQEVQMKTYLCYPKPSWVPYDITCACAVSIRAGGELFIIDVCTSPSLIRHVSCKEKLMDVRQIHDYNYEIHMPLGTLVAVSIESWPNPFSSLNIEISPSVKDVNRTEGLCGLLNDNPTDDFAMPSGEIAHNQETFRDSWRIDYNKSFLNPNHDPKYWEEQFYICVCPSAQIANLSTTISGNSTQPLCSPSMFLSCTKKKEFQSKEYQDCNIRQKRSGAPHTKEIKRILSNRAHRKETYFDGRAFRKKSTLTYTMEEARATCELSFNKSSVTVNLEGLPTSNASRESALHDCTLDLNATADMQLVDIHLSSFTEETERYLRQDSVTRIVYAQKVQAFYASACIDNCNGHGDCVNGTCVCQNPYIGEDCSISKTNPPAVIDTYMGGFCSRNNDECCGIIPFYGNRFVASVTKQKLERFEVFHNGTMEIVETNVTDLQILNAFEADMLVPCEKRERRSADSRVENNAILLATGVRVSLSNDGTNYGAPRYFYIYDAHCLGYEKDGNQIIFYVLHGKCYINGMCYSQGENDPTDPCKTCRPATNPYLFGGDCRRTESSPPLSQEKVIIVSVVGVMTGIILVIVIVLVIKMCFKTEIKVHGEPTSTKA